MTERRLAAEDPVARRSMDPDGCATSMLGISAGRWHGIKGTPARRAWVALLARDGQRRHPSGARIHGRDRFRRTGSATPQFAAEGLVGRR